MMSSLEIFFSITLDCTPDISRTEHLSVVIRIVSLQEKIVKEALIELRNHTKAQSLSEEVGLYRFSICTRVWYDILNQTHHVSKLMQSPNMHAM